MKITTRHPRSTHGVPVILSDAGQVINYARGIALTLDLCNITPAEIAARTGVSKRCIDHYIKGRRIPSAAFLNVLRDALEDATGT
jgi:transcriptional regulator with XRE-family HTH domain